MAMMGFSKVAVLHAGGTPQRAGARHVAAGGGGLGAVGGHGKTSGSGSGEFGRTADAAQASSGCRHKAARAAATRRPGVRPGQLAAEHAFNLDILSPGGRPAEMAGGVRPWCGPGFRTVSPDYHRRPMLMHPQFDPIALDLTLPRAAGADPLVWPDLPGRLRPVPVAGQHCAGAKTLVRPGEGWTRRDVEDLLFFGVMGVVIGGRLGYVLFYKPELLPAAPAGRSSRSGRAEWPSMAACWVWWPRCGCSAAAADGRSFLAGDRRDRALCAHRPGQRAHRQLHQRRAVGPRGRPQPALGHGVSAVWPGRWPVTRPSSISSRMEGLLLFALLWWYGRRDRPDGPGVGRLPDGLRRCSGSLRSTSVNLMPSWACRPWGMSMWPVAVRAHDAGGRWPDLVVWAGRQQRRAGASA